MIMSRTNEQPIIDIPIKLIFSKSGVSYFIKNNKKLSRFRLSDNREEYGIQLTDFTPATIQKMLILGYINEIEFPITKIHPYRNRIIDFTKLVTFGMLYMQFSTTIFDRVINSEIVQAWNRKNIKNPIDFKTEVNQQVLATFLSNNSAAFSDLKEQVIFPAIAEERRKRRYTEEEIERYRLMADKFLTHVNPLVWFLLITYQQTREIGQILKYIRSDLLLYLTKSSVAEYFAFMLIEVLISTQKLADQAIKESKDNQKGKEEFEIYLLWKFKKDMHRADDRGKLHVIISNSKSKFEEVRSSVHYRAGQSVKAKSLEAFYGGESSESGESHLGLYYLSFLEEACRSMNLKFESFVNYDRANQQTLINLLLTF